MPQGVAEIIGCDEMLLALLGMVLAQPGGFELPESPRAGWKATPQQAIAPSGIFEYMDGAGELYLAYGFKRLYVREYEKPHEPRVTCEVYRMGRSADAFGLFSVDRTGQALRIGQGAVYSRGLLVAWQGDYFVRILADRETPESKLCVVALAKLIVKKCGKPGKPPAQLSWLPKPGLDQKSVRFFHTHMCLNYLHFLASENILNLSANTNAVMGAYSGAAGKSLSLIIGYPSEAETLSAWKRFRVAYLAGLKADGEYSIARLENGKWFAGIRKGKRLCIVLESPRRADCMKTIKAVSR